MARNKPNNYNVDEANGVVHIELRRYKGDNLWTTVDLTDFEYVSKKIWCARECSTTHEFYAVTNTYKEHKGGVRTIDLQVYLLNPLNTPGLYVDHINGDTLDNRRSNLRIVSNSSNGMNRKGANKNNKSGYRNVSKIGNRWYVQLQVDGKSTVLGKFPIDQLEEAGKFAVLMRQKYYGEFAGKD